MSFVDICVCVYLRESGPGLQNLFIKATQMSLIYCSELYKAQIFDDTHFYLCARTIYRMLIQTHQSWTIFSQVSVTELLRCQNLLLTAALPTFHTQPEHTDRNGL